MSKQKNFILLRGLTRESRHWGSFPKRLQELYPTSNIVELDLPGAGSLYQESTPLSVDEITRRLRKLVPSAMLEQGNFVFIGVSLGGMVGLTWSQLYPKDLYKLIIINSSAAVISPFWKRLRARSYVPVIKSFLLKEKRHEIIFEQVCENKKNKDKLVKLWSKIQQENPVGLINAIKQILAAMKFKVEKINISGLILCSAKDQFVNHQCSKDLAKFLGWPIQIHPWAGHELPDDDPEWVINEIKKFIID